MGSVDTIVWIVGAAMASVSVAVFVHAVRQEGLDLGDLKAIVRRALHMREKE